LALAWLHHLVSCPCLAYLEEEFLPSFLGVVALNLEVLEASFHLVEVAFFLVQPFLVVEVDLQEEVVVSFPYLRVVLEALLPLFLVVEVGLWCLLEEEGGHLEVPE
jgi:hypothetical protein